MLQTLGQGWRDLVRGKRRDSHKAGTYCVGAERVLPEASRIVERAMSLSSLRKSDCKSVLGCPPCSSGFPSWGRHQAERRMRLTGAGL